MTLFNNLSPPHHPGGILENVNNVCCSVSAAPRFDLNMKTTYPHGAADTEQHMLFTFSGYSPK